MAATGGGLDHPSYLTRQMIKLGQTTAGANGTSLITVFPMKTRIRKVWATNVVLGTSASTGHQIIVYCLGTCTTYDSDGNGTLGTATTSLGSVALNTIAIGSVVDTGDLNAAITTGSIIFIKNGTDATGVASVTAEAYVDPRGVWTAGN